MIYCFQRDTMPFDAGGDSRYVLIPNAKLLSYSDSESAHIGLTIAVDRCALRGNRNVIIFILKAIPRNSRLTP